MFELRMFQEKRFVMEKTVIQLIVDAIAEECETRDCRSMFERKVVANEILDDVRWKVIQSLSRRKVVDL